MIGLTNLSGIKGLFETNSTGIFSKSNSQLSEINEAVSKFNFKTATNPSTSKEFGLFNEFNKPIMSLDDIQEVSIKKAEHVQVNQSKNKIKMAKLPDKVKNMVKFVHEFSLEQKEKIFNDLSKIYADSDGKKLVDKLVENNTKIEVHDPIIDGTDVDTLGYYSEFSNTMSSNAIILYEYKDNNNLETLIHEMGHAVTGQPSKKFDGPENDGYSLMEEIGSELMAKEMVARIEGNNFSKEEARAVAKHVISVYINDGLEVDNGFYEHIDKLLGIKIQNKFDVKELYNELKEEQPTKN